MRNRKRNGLIAVAVSSVGVVLSLGQPAGAAQIRPYESDANTVALLHLDETSGTTVTNSASFPTVGNWSTIGTPTRGLTSLNADFGTTYQTTSGNSAQLVYASTAQYPALTGHRQDYTVEAWVKWDGTGALNARQSMVSASLMNSGSGAGYYWSFELIPRSATTASLNLTYNGSDTGSARQIGSSTVAWDTAQWYHVALTEDWTSDGANGAVFKFYVTSKSAVDALATTDVPATLTPVGTVTQAAIFLPRTGGPTSTDVTMLLGYGGYGNQFNGQIDEVRISNLVRDKFLLPEPASAMLLLMGAGALVVRRRQAK